MRFLVQNHRFFAIAATIALITHLIIQINYRWVSTTGLIAAGLLVINAGLGAYGHYIRKKKHTAWFYLHRTCAVLLVLTVIVHLTTKI